MLKALMKNSIDENIPNVNQIKKINNNKNNLHFLNINQKISKIPKLYQKKKLAFLSKPIPKQNTSSKKEYENYTKIFNTKNIFKSVNYIDFNNKSNTINQKHLKNSTINKSNINTVNTTLNITNNNNNIFLNITNNNNTSSITNIISNNLYNINTYKNKIHHNKINSQIIISKNKNESDEDTNINDLINDETEEKIPVHISNYNGGIKGNDRDWGLSKTYAKGGNINKSEKDKMKYNNHSYYHKNNDKKFKYKSLCEDIKKKLLYEEQKKISFNKSNNKEINIENEKKNYLNNNILTSPDLNNINKIKKLNFDQPFRCIQVSNSNENIKKRRVNLIPKLTIDLNNSKNNNLYIKIPNNEISPRKTEKEGNNIFILNYSFENKKIYNQTEESSTYKDYIISRYNNKLNINNNYFHSNSVTNKNHYNTKKTKNEKDNKDNKKDKIICSYTIKRHKNNINLYKFTKLIRHTNFNKDKNYNKINLKLNDIIFEIKYIKFKHYIENYLDTKSLLVLSSVNKDFYKNFRNIIYNKYYDIILLDSNNKENINQIIKSLLKNSSYKLKNKSNEEIDQIYNSFNYKSIYNEHIIKDLTRTFPNDTTFNKNSLNYYKLFNILTTYSNFNKQIGYAQGLNFISAIGLSLFDTEKEVFVFIDGLLNRFGLIKYMGINNNLVKNLKYFSYVLNKYVPDIIAFFETKLVNHEFFSTNWIITLFSNCMHRKSLVIIWCFMTVFGWKFFYCFTIESLKFYKDDILKTEEKELNYKMKNLLNNDKFDKNRNLIIKNTFQLMKNCISL